MEANQQAAREANDTTITLALPTSQKLDAKASLGTLPTEVLLQILFQSHEPALINVSRRLRQVLPSYVRYAKSLAAIATCPEGPCDGLLNVVFERVMRQYHADCWILPLTSARIWEIREAVWMSTWFGSRQFEAIVLELYHSFLTATLSHVRPRLPDELIRLKEHALGCRRLDMISGEEFFGGLNFRGRRAGRRRKTSRGDLLVTFNQIAVNVLGQEHGLQFWGVRHLYDLPDGLFNTPITAHQVHLFQFLTTLDWHWKARSVLAPKRNEAFAAALDWAIHNRHLAAIVVLLDLYQKYCAAGNEKALNVKHHLSQCVYLQDRAMLDFVGRGFLLPVDIIEFFQEMSTRDGKMRMSELPAPVSGAG